MTAASEPFERLEPHAETGESETGHAPDSSTPAASKLESRIKAASAALLSFQREDGHWSFEFEADATIPAEYILLTHYLGEEANLEREAKIAKYLRRIQGKHGGWP